MNARPRAAALIALLLSLLLASCASTPRGAGAGAPAAMSTGQDGMIVVVVDNPADAGIAHAGSTPHGYDGAPSYSISPSARAAVATLAQKYGMEPVRAWAISQLQVYCVVFSVKAPAQPAAVLSALTQEPLVKSAQPLQRFSTLGASAGSQYNDPYIGLQHGFSDIDAGGAQQWSRGEGVRVAVIDTGLDSRHPDLQGRISEERNFVDADSNQFQRDRHGTAVAGIIAANANNHEGIVGVAPGVKIIALKACWQQADGTAACNSFTLAEALSAAMDAGVNIINLSLGGPADPLLAQLVNYALDHGVVVVGAVPPSGRLDGFPVGIEGVLAVDSGSSANHGSRVLPAPGREVLTLTPGGHYDFASGSSLATAHVSATAALLLASDHHLSASRIADTLRRSIRQTPQGIALINACLALASLHSGETCAAGPATVATGQ